MLISLIYKFVNHLTQPMKYISNPFEANDDSNSRERVISSKKNNEKKGSMVEQTRLLNRLLEPMSYKFVFFVFVEYLF